MVVLVDHRAELSISISVDMIDASSIGGLRSRCPQDTPGSIVVVEWESMCLPLWKIECLMNQYLDQTLRQVAVQQARRT
jgi:hypothetical protein